MSEELWNSYNNKGFAAKYSDYAERASKDEDGNDIKTSLADRPTRSEVTAGLNTKQDTIPNLSEIESGAAAGATAYQKPEGGIPLGDLSLGVQASLGNADTAVQPSALDGYWHGPINESGSGNVVVDVRVNNGEVTVEKGSAAVPPITSISLNGTDVPPVQGNVDLVISNPVPGTGTPAMDSGNGSAGLSTEYARADHVHPSDTSKQDTLTFNTAYDPANNKAATMSDIADGVSGKAGKVSGAVSGNFAGLDSNGDLTDSGSKASDFASAAQGSKADSAIQGITIAGGHTLAPDANKIVDIPVQTTISADGYQPVASSTLYSAFDDIDTELGNRYTKSETDDAIADAIDDLATVATSGSYNDLSNKPTIPSAPNNAKLNVSLAGGTATEWFSADASTDSSVTIPAATTTDPGLMTAADKTTVNRASAAIPGGASGSNQLVTASDLSQAIADFGGFEVVPGTGADHHPDLPSGETPSTKIIYLVDTGAATPDHYMEWICTNVSVPTWELIGETSIDLSNYYQKVNSPVVGNIVTFGSSGTLDDSSAKISDFATSAQGSMADSSVQGVKLDGASNPLTMDANNCVTIPNAIATGESGATNGLMTAADKATIAGLATVATSGDYEDLTNKPTIPAAQVNSDWNASSGVAEILHKPTLATVATSGQYSDLTGTPTLATVATTGAYSDLTGTPNLANVATSGDYSDLNNAPDLSIYAESSNLATVATSGSYNDLSDKPDLSIYAESANLSTVATSGDYDDLTNKPSIPAAQVNSDWNAVSGVSVILNKPSLSPVATSGNYSDLNNTPDLSIYAETSDLATVATTGAYSDLTGTPTLATVATTGAYSDLSGTPTLATVATTGAYSDLNNPPDLSIYAETSNLAAVATSGAYSDLSGTPSLATVATSGSYNDLSNKPSIPAAANDAAITIKMGGWASGVTGTDVGDFTTNQDTAEDITIPAAASASGNTAATPGVMSSADKEKLDGIESDAQVNEIESITVDSGSALPITNKNVNIDLSGKVDVVAGKGLSTNDYDATDKATVTKAAAVIPSNANAQNQLVTAQDLASALANFGGFKVSTGTGSDNHPDEANPDTKTIYLVKDTSVPGSDKYKEWICTDTTTTPVTWELIGDTSIDLSGYVEYPASHTDTHIVTFGSGNTIADSGVTVASLQNTVDTVSIDGTSYSPTSGTTDIAIPLAVNSNGSGTAGAMSGADKVKLDSIASGAQVNVKPDWNAAAGTTSEILNKPTIPSAANDGVLSITVGSTTTTFSADQSTNESVSIPVADYDDTSGSMVYTDGLMLGTDKEKLDAIEDGAQVNVKPDWNAASGADSEILHKPNIPAAANDGVLTITVGGTSTTFSADQSTNASVSISVANYDDTSGSMVYTDGLMLGTDKEKLDTLEPANDATITIKMGGWATGVTGTDVGDFSTDQDTAEDIVIPAAASASGNTPATPGVMSSDDKAKLDSISSGAEVNTIASVSANNAALTPDANRNVNIPLASYDDSGSPTVYTDGLMTGQDKEKLAGVATGAQVNVIEAITIDSGSALPVSSKTVNIDLSGKVDVVSGKGLSTNDYTTADKDVVTNASQVIPSSATSSNPLVDEARLASVIADFGGFKQATGTGADMHPDVADPSTKFIYLVKDTSIQSGDVYKEWICTNTTGPVWELVGDTQMNLSNYTQLPSSPVSGNIVTFGQDNVLVDSGSTIASLTNTVETVSIGAGSAISPTSGTTNIVIPLAANSNGSGTDGAMSGTDKVKLDSITDGAEPNTVNTISIGAGSSISPTTGTTNIVIPLAANNGGTGTDGAMTGADKVKLDGIAAGAEPNVQSDWDEANSTSDAYIANKPDIIIPLASPAAQGGISAPKYLMVVTTMPPAAQIDPDTIYLVQGTYIGT